MVGNNLSTLENFALTPSTLIESLYIQADKQIVSVKGEVASLRPWPEDNPRKVYGDITWEGSTIEFECKPGFAPTAVGQYLIVRGSLSTKPKNFGSGFQLLIKGEVVDEWEPSLEPSQFTVLARHHGRLNLRSFLEQNALKDLLIITTDTAENDVNTGLNIHHSNEELQVYRGNFGSSEKMQSCIANAVSEYKPKAIALVRGGGGDIYKLWNDAELIRFIIGLAIPFYSAIGHSDHLCLIDKYADEAFSTPEGFGHALGMSISAINEDKAIRKKFYNASAENKELAAAKKELIQFQETLLKKTKKQRIIFASFSVVLTAVTSAVGYWFWVS